MDNCATCFYGTPGFVAVDVASLFYEGTIAYEPCPTCNGGRRTVYLTDRKLLTCWHPTDRDGFPKDFEGSKERPSWRPRLRGGAPPPDSKLIYVSEIKRRSLTKQAGYRVAKQGALLPEKGRPSPGI